MFNHSKEPIKTQKIRSYRSYYWKRIDDPLSNESQELVARFFEDLIETIESQYPGARVYGDIAGRLYSCTFHFSSGISIPKCKRLTINIKMQSRDPALSLYCSVFNGGKCYENTFDMNNPLVYENVVSLFDRHVLDWIYDVRNIMDCKFEKFRRKYERR